MTLKTLKPILYNYNTIIITKNGIPYQVGTIFSEEPLIVKGYKEVHVGKYATKSTLKEGVKARTNKSQGIER